MAISVDGIVSGIDTTSLISELSSAYSAPKDLIEDDISDAESLQSAMTTLSGLLGNVSDALEEITEIEDFRTFTAAYEENDDLAVETDGEAIAGVYSIEIDTLATSELEASNAFSDHTTTGVISEGTLSVTYAGETTEITVDSSNSSLVELAASIDDVEGITAYVMDTGDASTPYRLIIQGEDTGSANTIELDTSGLTGAGTVPTFTEQSSAGDATLSINGIDVTSDSNTVSDSIAGLSFVLTGTTTEAIDVTVALDTASMEEKVQTFVDAYNSVTSYVNSNSNAADEDSDIAAGLFNGDSSVRRIMQTLQSSLSTTYTTNDLSSLGLMGIGTDGDGTLSLESDDFLEALDDYQGSVEDMFTADDGFAASLIDALDVYIDPIDGAIKQRNDTLEDSIDDLEDQVTNWEDRIERYEDRLRSSFNAFESSAGVMQGVSSFLQAYFFGVDS
jgi:flagellar hook-associated protein 2